MRARERVHELALAVIDVTGRADDDGLHGVVTRVESRREAGSGPASPSVVEPAGRAQPPASEIMPPSDSAACRGASRLVRRSPGQQVGDRALDLAQSKGF
jgi:hypothetical protein